MGLFKKAFAKSMQAAANRAAYSGEDFPRFGWSHKRAFVAHVPEPGGNYRASVTATYDDEAHLRFKD